MGKKKLPQDTSPKQPTGPTLKQVHRSGEVLIPGGVGVVIPFARPKPKPPSISKERTEEEILSSLDRPGIIGQEDMLTLQVLQDQYQETKEDLERFQNVLIYEMEKGTPVETGRRKLRITGIYMYREEDAE